jgi:SAM-dependent methyltransferase
MNRNIEDPKQIELRRKELNNTKSKNWPTYASFIKGNCAGDKVVDFGFVNHSENTSNIDSDSSHQTITEVSKNVLAIDIIDYSGIRFKNSHYFIGDILGKDLRSLQNMIREEFEYDVFFAGNVVEHLDNAGQLLDAAKLMLKSGGKLVITTVNPLWFIGLWDRVTLNYQSNCIDHVSLLGPQEFIELGNRYNFSVESWSYIGIENMVEKFQPGGKINGRMIGYLYSFLRWRSLGPAYNMVGIVMVKK